MIHLALWIASFLFLCLVGLLLISGIASVIAAISDARFRRKQNVTEEECKPAKHKSVQICEFETDRVKFLHNQKKAAEDMAYAARYMENLRS